MHQLGSARLAHDAVLGEGDDLNVDDAAELVAYPDKCLDAFQTRLAVNVGESADVQIAVQRRQRHGAARVLDDPRLGVFFLDLAGELDAGERLAHLLALIGLERLLLHHRQRPHLAEMKVGIDVGFGHQIAPGVDFSAAFRVETFSDRGDTAVGNADLNERRAAAPQPGPANDDIELLSHGQDRNARLRRRVVCRLRIVGCQGRRKRGRRSGRLSLRRPSTEFGADVPARPKADHDRREKMAFATSPTASTLSPQSEKHRIRQGHASRPS